MKIEKHWKNLRVDYRKNGWGSHKGRLLRLSDHIVKTAYTLGDAKKPHDIVFPTTRMLDLINQVKEVQWEWIADKIGLDPRDKGRWPKV